MHRSFGPVSTFIPCGKNRFVTAAGSIAFLANLVVAPHKTAERDFGAVGQLPNAHHPAQAVVRELGPLISGVDGDKTILAHPIRWCATLPGAVVVLI